jgi:DnaJ-domain-containing protein 1
VYGVTLGEFFVFIIIAGIIYVLYKEFLKEGGFSALLCDLGFHKFDTWKYINENNCEKRKACSVCGEIQPNSESKIEHSWATSYLREKSCEKQETCSHCRERRGEIIVEHTWLESYIGENSNKKHRECSRCSYQGAIQISQTQWSWVFENGEKRRQFLSLQIAIQQISLSDDIFSISNNSRDKQVKVIEAYLPDTNLKVYGLNIGTIDFMFYPDGIYAFQQKRLISSMLYTELSFNVSKVRVENSNVPRDGEVVGRTWLHSRKNGGPDLRYIHNPAISIIAYTLLAFGTPKDSTYQIAMSNSVTAQKLYNEYNAYLNSYSGRQQKREYSHQNSYSYSSQQDSRNSDNANDSQKSSDSKSYSQNEPSGKLTLESARKILDVRTGTSQDEIRKAYLELVQKYHPDKVFHLADEYKVIAENKMKEINAAYMLLKESM